MVKTAGAPESANTLTFYDVARVADVSIGTVSRVLNNLPNVDPNLRVRVLKAIDELGYIHVTRKRRTAPNLPTVRRKLPIQPLRHSGSPVKEITLCVPVRKTPALQISYFYKILNEAQAECARRKIALMYSVVEDGPGALAILDEAIQRGNADAILLVNFGAPELVEGLYKRGVPCIIVDPRHYPAVPMDVVTSDSLDGNMLAMKHLLNLGHRDIAFINGPNRYATQHRLFGYELALFEQGIPVRPELITSTEMTSEGGEAAIQELLDRKVDFTAVLCANDYMAFGALRTLQAAGKRVPEDISVIGFGDLEPSEHYNWPLTTINDFNEVKGRLAIRQLLERAANPAELPVRINLPLELVVRGTTAPVKQ